MNDGSRGHERAEQAAERERRAGHAEDHPDPARDLDRDHRERCDGVAHPRPVVVDEGVRRFGANTDREAVVLRRIPRIDTENQSATARPHTREVVEVDHLEPARERSPEGDEQDADGDRSPVREIGAALAGHAPQGYRLYRRVRGARVAIRGVAGGSPPAMSGWARWWLFGAALG